MTRSSKKNSADSLVLLSGGIDSVCALHRANHEHRAAHAVFFSYGSKHNRRELPCARYHCRLLDLPLTVLSLPFIAAHFRSHLLDSGGPIPDGHYQDASMRQTVVPFRNGIFLAAAAGLAESLGLRRLVIAAHAGDHAVYPDCRPAFLDAAGRAIALGTYAHVRLHAPFRLLTKTQIVRIGRRLGVDFAHTWSCYKGQRIHCGTCGTCVERREAFTRARVPDPTAYATTNGQTD